MGRESHRAIERAKHIASLSPSEAKEYLRQEKRAKPERSEGSLERAGSASPDQSAHKLREAMNAMEQEQWDEYQEYVKRCGGVPISKIPASRPVRPNNHSTETR